jgi:hypothetical protein
MCYSLLADLIVVLGFAVIIINAAVYFFVIRKWIKR